MGTVHDINPDNIPTSGGWKLERVTENEDWFDVLVGGERIGSIEECGNGKWRPTGEAWEAFAFDSIAAAANAVTEDHGGGGPHGDYEPDDDDIASALRTARDIVVDMADQCEEYDLHRGAMVRAKLAVDSINEALALIDPDNPDDEEVL
jgi:hypothetical protein